MQNLRKLAALALMAAASSASALTINATFDGTITSRPDSAQIQTAMGYAITEFQNEMSDNVTLNITVSTGPVGLGQSNFFLTAGGNGPGGLYSYTNIKNLLSADPHSATDVTALANLGVSDPTSGGGFWVTTAQARALGQAAALNLSNATQDGTFTFSSSSAYTYDPQNRQVAGKFDFIAVAQHEMSEIMGRAFGLNVDPTGHPAYQTYDLYRFTGNNTRSLTSTATGVYFSIDNGATNLHGYNSGAGDIQDWDSSIHDSFNAATPNGQENDLTPSDITALDVIGYDVANAANLTWNGNNSGGLWDTAFTANWNNHTTLKASDVYRVSDNVTFDNTATTFNVLINANQYPGSVTVNSGSNFTFSSNVNAGILGAAALTKLGTGSLTITQPNGYTGGTSVSGGVLIVAHPGALGTGGLALHTGGTTHLQAGLASGVKLPSVTFDGSTNAWTGTLDVANDKLVIEPTTGRAGLLANLENQAVYGHTHATGITSSTATASMSVAVIDNAILGRSTFGGVSVGSNSILISQELLGDTNIDGKVDATDLSKVLNNFGSATMAWTSGNFDGTATVDLTDLSYVLNNFGDTYSSSFDVMAGSVVTDGTAPDQAIAQDLLSGNMIAVPEPASIGLLLAGGTLLLKRRRVV